MALNVHEAAPHVGILLFILPFALSAITESPKGDDLSDIDAEKLNEIVNRAKTKFDSADSFLDDTKPSDYFVSIAIAGSYLERAAKPVDDIAWPCEQPKLVESENASCQEVMSDVDSDTYFLGELTPEELVNATFAKAGEIMQPLMSTFASRENATTQREVATVRKLQLTIVDLLQDLVWYLANVLPIPALTKVKRFRNACKFAARYQNYSVEELKNLFDKYTYIALYAQAICEHFLGEGMADQNWAKKVEIVRSMRASLELLDDLPDKPNGTIICVKEEFTQTTWLNDTEAISEQIIDKEVKRLRPRTWYERQDLHKAVANRVVVRLNNSTYKDEPHSFMALAYLPYRSNDPRYFIQNSSDVFANEYNLVNYVVARYRTNISVELRAKWDVIYERRKNILDSTFPLGAYDLEERITAVQSRLENGVIHTFLSGGGFKALAALKCGYEFVWYELGYRYFPAGYSTGNYTLSADVENKYSWKCGGQIILFP